MGAAERPKLHRGLDATDWVDGGPGDGTLTQGFDLYPLQRVRNPPQVER